jgi:hypothetical protein
VHGAQFLASTFRILHIKNKMIKLRALVAKGQKSSNAPQFGILLFCGQTTYRNGPFQGIFRGGQDFF